MVLLKHAFSIPFINPFLNTGTTPLIFTGELIEEGTQKINPQIQNLLDGVIGSCFESALDKRIKSATGELEKFHLFCNSLGSNIPPLPDFGYNHDLDSDGAMTDGGQDNQTPAPAPPQNQNQTKTPSPIPFTSSHSKNPFNGGSFMGESLQKTPFSFQSKPTEREKNGEYLKRSEMVATWAREYEEKYNKSSSSLSKEQRSTAYASKGNSSLSYNGFM